VPSRGSGDATRRVVVTGGASGIGAAIVERHRGAGDQVVVLDRTAVEDGSSVCADVADHEDARSAVDRAAELMGGLDVGSDWTALLGGFLVVGAGVGLINPVIADVAVSVVPKEQSGMAAGINDTFRQVGVAVGIAVWGAIFVGEGASKVAALTAGTPAAVGDRPREIVEAASSGNLNQVLASTPPGSRATIVHAAREGFKIIYGRVLPGNQHMLELAEWLGLTLGTPRAERVCSRRSWSRSAAGRC